MEKNFNLNDDVKLFGDAMTEYEFIKIQMDATREAPQIRFIESEEERRMKELTENGVEYVLNNLFNDGYKIGDPLTIDQRKALTKDMVLYEYQIINGNKVLVPILYYAYNSGKMNDNRSTIESGNDMILITNNDLINSGNIISNKDLTIISDNDIINRGGTIQTNSDNSLLKLIAGNTITNKSIINSNTFKTTVKDKQLTNVYNELISQGNIKSNGSLILNAESDINIIGSNLSSKSDTIIQSENGNINILAEQVYNRMEDYNKSKSFMFSSETHQIEESVKNVSSNITSEGSLSIITKGNNNNNNNDNNNNNNNNNINSSINNNNNNNNNINILGSILSAKEDLELNSEGNINILNVKDTDYSYYYQMKQKADIGSMVTNITAAIAVGAVTGGAGAAAMAGITAGAGATQMKKGSITINEDYDETIVSSILNGKNIKIKSKGDTNIQSSELNAIDNKILNIKGQLNITQDTEEHRHEHTEEKFGGNIINAAIAGAITGLTANASIGGGEIFNSSVLNTITTSYTTSVGNSMSNTLLNGGSLKDTLKTGVKSLTDKDIIKNSIANGITSSLTTGITNQLNFGFNNQFTNALKEATVSTISNTVVESTLNGKSFEETLKDQFVTSIVMAGANLATKGIGSNYHEGNINKGTQLLLHGVVGAASSKLLGKDALSGATSSIIGEVTGELLGENTKLSDDALKEIGGLAGGLSALVTGGLQGLDESEISSNIFNGQRLGKNAVENNYVLHAARDLDNPMLQLGRHTFLVLAPDNPEDFTPEKLIEQGLNPDDFKFVDLGDGKKSLITGGYHKDGSLVSEINNKTDIKSMRDYYINGKSTAYGSNSWFWDFDVETKEIKPKKGVSDTEFIYNIIKNTKNYQENTKDNSVKYGLIPSCTGGYNCNSFSNSLLNYSGSGQNKSTDFKGNDTGRNQLIDSSIFKNR